MKNLELKLYQVLCGYYHVEVKGNKYKIIYPSLDVKYRTELLYISILEDDKYETSYLSKAQLKALLAKNEIWNSDMENQLKESKEQLDKYKIKLYQNYFNTIKADIKEAITAIKQNIQELSIKKGTLDYLTLEEYATSIKNQYSLSQCIYTMDNKKVFHEDFDKVDISKLNHFLQPVSENQVTAQQLRDIVKQDCWKAYVCQDNIFGNSIDLNDDQRNLLSLERMYQNAREHPECPDEKILDDDDALDGWFLYQKDQNKKNRKKKEAFDKIGGNVNKHDNVYIINDNIEDHRAILEMNDSAGKGIIKSMEKAVEEKGEVLWQDIPAVKRDIHLSKDNQK